MATIIFALAYFTGNVQVIEGTDGVFYRCEYNASGDYFWRDMSHYCPLTIENE